MIEPVLEGYDATFLGMLESPSDGLGVWQMKDLVLAGIAVNATFQSFAKLCEGGYGAQPTRADQVGHCFAWVLLVTLRERVHLQQGL